LNIGEQSVEEDKVGRDSFDSLAANDFRDLRDVCDSNGTLKYASNNEDFDLEENTGRRYIQVYSDVTRTTTEIALPETHSWLCGA
jgi:hypothetical protein